MPSSGQSSLGREMRRFCRRSLIFCSSSGLGTRKRNSIRRATSATMDKVTDGVMSSGCGSIGAFLSSLGMMGCGSRRWRFLTARERAEHRRGVVNEHLRDRHRAMTTHVNTGERGGMIGNEFRNYKAAWQRKERNPIREDATPLAKQVMLNEITRAMRTKGKLFCDSCNRRKHPAHQRCIGVGNDAWRALAS